MSTSSPPDVRPGRLSPDEYTRRFADAAPCLSPVQALMEAQRCLYCFDAPCASACPTGIDVPSFIRRIAEGNLRGAASAILEANALGGMCARVCPTENLCEAVCVRHSPQSKPVAIGRLQRHAVDALMQGPRPQIFTRAPSTGKKVAVVGAGPAGLSCAHGLARLGHDVVIHDAHPKPGGLNEYGLARYKTPNDFAQSEIAWLLDLGGMTLKTGWKLEQAAQLDALRAQYDAVFLALGLNSSRPLDVPGQDLSGVQNAIDFIAALRQANDLATLPVGRRVVVIGGGMTAIDAAVQSKLLGASSVHLVYRRGPEEMPASTAEQEWALTHGVVIVHWLAPLEITGQGQVEGVRFARQALAQGKLTATGEVETLPADMVLSAIGQQLGNPVLLEAGLTLDGARLATDESGLTSLPGVWAGGDCRAGLDLTVQAVEHGKQSARAIHIHLGGA